MWSVVWMGISKAACKWKTRGGELVEIKLEIEEKGDFFACACMCTYKKGLLRTKGDLYNLLPGVWRIR